MIGKHFKFKLLENTSTKTVTNVKDGFIIFDDGSRVEENKLNGLFDEVPIRFNDEENTSTTSNIIDDISKQIANESAAYNIPQVKTETPVAQSDVIDPTTFFDNSNIANRISKNATNINLDALSKPATEADGVAEIQQAILQDMQEQELNEKAIKQVEAKRKDFDSADAEFAGYDKNGNPIQPNQPENAEPIDPGYDNQGNPIQPSTYPNQHAPLPQQSGFPMLKQMKRNNKIKLKFEIDETIPKPDFIKMMDENFDGGVLDYLVTDMVNKMLSDPMSLEKQIRESLEEIVYNKKKKTTRTRKTTPKPKVKVNEKDNTKVVSTKTTESKKRVSKQDTSSKE